MTGGVVGCPTTHGCCRPRRVPPDRARRGRSLRATEHPRHDRASSSTRTTRTSIYQSSFAEGIWRSLDNGATWTQIKSALNAAQNTDRAQFALSKLPGGKTRMYVGDGNAADAGANRARFYRTDDAAGAAVFTDMTTSQNIGYCTAQCWYDNVVYSPAGDPNVVYLGGSYSLRPAARVRQRPRVLLLDRRRRDVHRHDASTGRRRLAPPGPARARHVPGEPLAVDRRRRRRRRSLERAATSTRSAQCDSRGADRGRTSRSASRCSRGSRTQIVHLNKGLVDAPVPEPLGRSEAPAEQPHGRHAGQRHVRVHTARHQVWPQIIYGDGGQSGWNAADSTLRFNTFTGAGHDVNFQNGDPTKWVIISGPIVGEPRGLVLLPADHRRPEPGGGGLDLRGLAERLADAGLGRRPGVPRGELLRVHDVCANPNCGDFVRIGPAGVTDLTVGRAYGVPRRPQAAFVAAIERRPEQHRHDVGRDRPAACSSPTTRTTRCRGGDLDAARHVGGERSQPVRLRSIYVDPANPNHAWISYSGYNINTPAQPGHVFEVTRTGGTATWIDLTYNLQDLPVTDLVRDDLTGDLYAATDFAVMKLAERRDVLDARSRRNADGRGRRTDDRLERAGAVRRDARARRLEAEPAVER